MTCVFSDGLKNISSSDKQPEKIWPTPCKIWSDDGAFKRFKARHVLPSNVIPQSQNGWVNYLTTKGLCGREPVQSFIEEGSIENICNYNSYRKQNNECVSAKMLTVYRVSNTLQNDVCTVKNFYNDQYYVSVVCGVISKRCVPVHYVTQSKTAPSRTENCGIFFSAWEVKRYYEMF